MNNRLLTIDDLYYFCSEYKLYNFDAKKTNQRLFVQIPATFVKRQSDDFTLFADIKAFHIGRNLNGSSVTDKAADHIMKTLAYKPVLANFTDINGELDFTSHDMVLIENENGEEEIEYIERQVGCFTADKPYKKYDEKNKCDYIYARVAIPRNYTEAANIIERKNGTDVSIELEVFSLSYDAKDKLLLLEDAEATGITLLGVDPETGEKVNPGMKNAHISLDSFSEQNNSRFVKFNEDSELLKELRRFNENFEALHNSNNNENDTNGKEEEPMNSLEILMKAFSVTEEDIDFEVEGLSDEELEDKFTEKFGEVKEESEEEAENSEDACNGEEETPAEGDENFEENEPEEKKEDEENGEEPKEVASEDEGIKEEKAEKNYSLILPDGTKKEFSLSLSEIEMSLYELVNDKYAEVDNTIYMTEVYLDDKNVVMIDFFSGAAYRQKFNRRKDTFSLEGDRVSVRANWLTEDEEKALSDMKSNYAETTKKLENYEAEPEKVELLNAEAYSSIQETDEYKELSKRDAYFELDKADLEKKLDDIILKYAKSHKLDFAAKNDGGEKKVVNRKGFITGLTGGKKSRYGNLFAK